MQKFRWQGGYGIFSISKSLAPDVIDYFKKQRELHKKQSFEDEYVSLLNLHGLITTNDIYLIDSVAADAARSFFQFTVG